MKLFGWNILTDSELSFEKASSYDQAIQDIKIILQNKDKHVFFFEDAIITKKDMSLEKLVFLGRIMKVGTDLTITGNLTLGSGTLSGCHTVTLRSKKEKK